MTLSRREFLQLLGSASLAGLWSPARSSILNGFEDSFASSSSTPSEFYNFPTFGNVSLLHFTDCHAQLMPSYFREPNIHLGVGKFMKNQTPHHVGQYALDHYRVRGRSELAHALTYLDFPELAAKYGKTGGFAHLATLINKLRAERPGSLLLDGGDTWQGSATSLWTNAQDMVDAALLLGVDVMTGHWEFTYGMKRLMEILKKDFAGKIEFLAQNISDNEFGDIVFKPYTMREINGIQVAIIGQAFPYTPIANPRRFVSKYRFGIEEEHLQKVVDKARREGATIVSLLSHNGMDIDLKLAKRVTGIDIILGGHTHDAVPIAIEVNNSSGITLVANSGTSGKFLSVIDMDVRDGKLQDYRYKLLPVFSNYLEPDKKMAAYIESVRAPYREKLGEELAVSHDVLYRRGTFNGTFDQIIVDALLETQDAEIAFSPGFRWGTCVIPGEPITMENLMNQTSLTYPQIRRNTLTGAKIKEVLEDIADNRFNPDPYMQQGGDMVRVGGLHYSIDPNENQGHRIQDLELNGKKLESNKRYSVASWASMTKHDGPAIWDVVAEYLRQKKVIRIGKLNTPKIKHSKGNTGIA